MELQECYRCGRGFCYPSEHPLTQVSLCEECLQYLSLKVKEFHLRSLVRRLEKKYSVAEILPLIDTKGNSTQRKILDGNPIKNATLRLKTFRAKGITCVNCGLVGEYFVLERSEPGNFHLNLYAIKDGVEILMTHDHIIPKASGGSERLSNLQTMCKPCNEAKGCKLPDGVEHG